MIAKVTRKLRCAALLAAALLAAALAAGCAKHEAAAPGGGAAGTAQGAVPGGAGSAQGGPGGQGARRGAAVAVQAALVQAGLLSADRDTAGVVTPSIQSSVAVSVSGIVSRVLRQAGEWVERGEVVVQLDDSLLRIALANAQAAQETAKINLAAVQDSTGQNNVRLALQVQSAQAQASSAQRFHDSQKALYELGGISASALDNAAGQLASAQAALESAKTALDQNQRGLATTPNQNVDALKLAVVTATNNLQQAQFNLQNAAVKAPFAGQVSAMNAAPGAFVGQNSAAFVLVSAERQVNFNVAPQDAPALPAGTPLAFAVGGATYQLRVKQSPSAPVGGLVPLSAVPAGRMDLPFGAVGNVRYRIALARGVIVPITALETQENRNYVFVVEGGKTALRYVSVVAESGAETVLAGIEAGSTVILNAPPGLLPGTAVNPIFAAGAATPRAPAAGAPGRP